MLNIELPEKRKVGRPERGFMDAVKKGMREAEVTIRIHINLFLHE